MLPPLTFCRGQPSWKNVLWSPRSVRKKATNPPVSTIRWLETNWRWWNVTQLDLKQKGKKGGWFQITSIFAPIPPFEDLTHLCSRSIFFQWVAHQLTFSIGKVVIGRGEKVKPPQLCKLRKSSTPAVFWKQLIIIHKCVESIHSLNFSKSKKRKFEIQRTLVLWNIGILLIFFWVFSMCHWGVGRRLTGWRLRHLLRWQSHGKSVPSAKPLGKTTSGTWDFAKRNLFCCLEFFSKPAATGVVMFFSYLTRNRWPHLLGPGQFG